MRAALIMSFVFAAACSGPAPEEFTTKDAGTIRQQHEAFVTAFNAKQIDPILNLYAENSVFMPPNAPLLRGREPLKGFYTDLVSRVSDLKLEPADIAGHGPIAYESGTYTMNLGSVRDRGPRLEPHAARHIPAPFLDARFDPLEELGIIALDPGVGLRR